MLGGIYERIMYGAHTLIGGSTGCGKSTLIDTIMVEILGNTKWKIAPRFYLIDPKMVSLVGYKALKTCKEYATDDVESLMLLNEVIHQMKYRYQYMQAHGQKLIAANDIYVVIDELADLMTSPTVKNEIRLAVQKIAQLGRAARIHLIAATQCPARRIIPAELTLNFTERIALKCLSGIESRQILGVAGAEKIGQKGIGLISTQGNIYKMEIPMYSAAEISEAIRSFNERAV